MRQTIKLILVSLLIILCCDSLTNGDVITTYANSMEKVTMKEADYATEYLNSMPPSLQVYHSIKKYCKIYDVPEIYAFKVAKLESGYNGPFHKNYNPYNKISSANALGAMQVLLSTARDVWQDNTIPREKLLDDVDFNVHTSIKYMRQTHDDYNNWGKVFAVYNTGRTGLNEYALSVIYHNK